MSYLIVVSDRKGKLRAHTVTSDLERILGECHPFKTLFDVRATGRSMVFIRIRRSYTHPAHEEVLNQALQTVDHHFGREYQVSFPEVDRVILDLVGLKLELASPALRRR